MNAKEKRDLVNFRLTKARSTLNEIHILTQNKFWTTAINRLYYACFYAVTALLIENNIKTNTHSGVRQMFSLHFIKNGLIDSNLGRFYSDIFELRHSGDYDDYFTVDEQEVLELIEPAEKLINRIEEILK